tara:strand:+ start:31125 stop:32570 length:1446 start_codon:yes stop_codon:yes gene_type:complete
MRRNIVVLFFLSTVSIFAQTEFKDHGNGLIYSNEAMTKLSQIVESENQQFRICDFSKTFTSSEQSHCEYFYLPAEKYSAILNDVKGAISKADFIKKYVEEEIGKQLVVKMEYLNYKEIPTTSFTLYPSENSITFETKLLKKNTIGNWIIDHSEYGVEVLYLENAMSAIPLPARYSKMLQYSECLIDTTVTIHPKGATRTGYRFPKREELTKQDELLQYIEKRFGKKPPVLKEGTEYNDGEYEQYWNDTEIYETEKDVFVSSVLYSDKGFKELLLEAYNEAITTKESLPILDSYFEDYLSKKHALQIKRNRIVVGTCSMDSSPRYHALEIAHLAAESYSWDVFLRAHLNIMNDNFQRASDGSYAWGQRQTYIKELEALQINVKELLFGIALSSSNVSKNHYYGNVRRLGRAISESKDVSAFKTELLRGIKDDKLDDYNRILFFYLYANLQYNLDQREEKAFNTTYLDEVKSFLPAYLAGLTY